MYVGTFAVALALAPGLLFGQPSPNTVTVTVSRGSNAQPDQAVFSVVVDSGIDRSLDDIVRALAGSGIAAANLSGVNFQSTQASAPIVWTFQWTAPLANVKAAIASLTSLQRSISQNSSGLSLSFGLQYAQTSPQQFQNCDLRGLIADATAQAQQTAGAAGLNATAIVGLDQAVSQPAAGCALTATFALGYSGHPGPHTITITASRNVSLPPPDQVVIANPCTPA